MEVYERTEYDLFISHATEDKSVLARELSTVLAQLGVRVWFDEECLQIGDSLSRTIDRGLACSRFGLIIISRHFLRKPWPEYELRGLLAKEAGGEKVILPVWLDVSRDEVLEYSPPLADKVALQYPRLSIHQIGIRILRVVRPDLADQIMRYLMYRRSIAEGERNVVSTSTVEPGPVRHDKLSPSLRVRIRLFHAVLGEAAPTSVATAVDNFRRDVQPGDEVAVWERIAMAFHDLTSRTALSRTEKNEVFSELLRVSLGLKHEHSRREIAGLSAERIHQAFLDACELDGEPETELA